MSSLVRSVICGLLCSLVLTGCGRQSESQLRTYGYSNGNDGNRSINGYGAFRKMFQQRGDKTFTAVSFSKALETMDTIVWTPDTVTPPSVTNRDTLEEWLASKSGRTLVYIGRDFDASSDYWEHVVSELPSGQKTRAMREQMLSRVEAMENDLGGVHFARWFVVDTTPVIGQRGSTSMKQGSSLGRNCVLPTIGTKIRKICRPYWVMTPIYSTRS